MSDEDNFKDIIVPDIYEERATDVVRLLNLVFEDKEYAIYLVTLWSGQTIIKISKKSVQTEAFIIVSFILQKLFKEKEKEVMELDQEILKNHLNNLRNEKTLVAFKEYLKKKKVMEIIKKK
jgi:hypothetical protein